MINLGAKVLILVAITSLVSFTIALLIGAFGIDTRKISELFWR